MTEARALTNRRTPTTFDGDFDRSGLPEVVVISHRIEMAEGKIAKLTCRLAG